MDVVEGYEVVHKTLEMNMSDGHEVVHTRMYDDPQTTSQFLETHIAPLAIQMYTILFAIMLVKNIRIPREILDCIVDLMSAMDFHCSKEFFIRRYWVSKDVLIRDKYDETIIARFEDSLAYKNRYIFRLEYPLLRELKPDEISVITRTYDNIPENSYQCELLFTTRGFIDLCTLLTDDGGASRRLITSNTCMLEKMFLPNMYMLEEMIRFRRENKTGIPYHSYHSLQCKISYLFNEEVFSVDNCLCSVVELELKSNPFEIRARKVFREIETDYIELNCIIYRRLDSTVLTSFGRKMSYDTGNSYGFIDSYIERTQNISKVRSTLYISFGLLISGRKHKLWVTLNVHDVNQILAICWFDYDGACHIFYASSYARQQNAELVTVSAKPGNFYYSKTDEYCVLEEDDYSIEENPFCINSPGDHTYYDRCYDRILEANFISESDYHLYM
ncbi:MAG: hypothetical protein JSS82_00200 [Bacteroidetes bacterium]|nr:hypothetical protein [Bacteroidota bacterium]